MAKFQLVLEDRGGRKTALTVEDTNSTEAAKQGDFYRNVYGKVVAVKPVPAQ